MERGGEGGEGPSVEVGADTNPKALPFRAREKKKKKEEKKILLVFVHCPKAVL